VDLKTAFDAAGEIPERWSKDPLHPSPEGNRLAAAVIRRELETRGLLETTKPGIKR